MKRRKVSAPSLKATACARCEMLVALSEAELRWWRQGRLACDEEYTSAISDVEMEKFEEMRKSSCREHRRLSGRQLRRLMELMLRR